jgi:AraC-like DNA-binding protein
MHSPQLDPTATIPASYGLSLLLSLREKGHDEAAVLEGTHLASAAFRDQRAQIALWQYATMMANARKLDTEGGLAYELGLRSQVTKHGFVGFGLMSCANLREAIAFAERYFQARVSSVFVPIVSVEGDEVVIEIRESLFLGSQRAFTLDMMLVEVCCLFAKVLGTNPAESGWSCEIHVPYAEPPAYARYRARLPRFHFNRPAVQIRFPARMLDESIATADSVSVQLAIDRCEQEMSGKPASRTVASQVASQLVCRDGSYPDIGLMAQWLRMSERTLKRRLQDEGSSFQTLLDQVRRRDSESLLANGALAIKQVAEAVGYGDPANFARAFSRWTGLSPREWRKSRSQGTA